MAPGVQTGALQIDVNICGLWTSKDRIEIFVSSETKAAIAHRTGHRSSAMIDAYRRLARTFEELNLGELGPLDLAIPELTNTLWGWAARWAAREGWRGSQVVRQRFAKPSYVGSNPIHASKRDGSG